MALASKVNLEEWKPKTALGIKVKNKEITDISEILDSGMRILEPEIVDSLLPGIHVELLEVGRSKGKFGGGKGSIWKQTQKKTSEGTTIKFSAFAVVGNRNGYVGIGYGGAKETVPAREKAIRNAKLNLIKIKRGCGSWDCGCKLPHSIPLKVSGKSGSVEVFFMPAPRGAGLKADKKCSSILTAAGVRDIYTRTEGKTATKLNFLIACFAALKSLSNIKTMPSFDEAAGVVEGAVLE